MSDPVPRIDPTPAAARRSSLDDVIDLYKLDVDRTILRENLLLTPDQRVRKMIDALEFVEALQRAPKRSRP